MSLVITHGTLVTATDTYQADLRIENGQISAIGQHLARPGDTLLSAQGRYILPGGVDVHTHLDMPAGAFPSSDDFFTGTRAALFGGTTSIIDFVGPARGQSLLQALDQWHAKAAGKAVTDYGFHMTVPEVRPETLLELDRVLAAGIPSVKVFTAYPGMLMIDDADIYRILRWAAHNGGLVQLHAENGPVIAARVQDLIDAGHTDPRFHAVSRPPELEGEATARVIALAELTQAPLYVVHLTCTQALEAVRQARQRGSRVWAETCPQYLYLSVDELAREGFEGARFVCSPPLREASHAPYLWQGLARGILDTVATDHCPFHFHGQKERGRGDFRRIPNGLPGIEPRLSLMHQGVLDGHISLNRFVELTSTAPARLFGIYPQKGALVPGADADLVLWDPMRKVSLDQEALHMRVDYSPYQGRTVQGGPDKVLLRGEVVVDGSSFLGTPGTGRFLPRPLFRLPAP